MTEKKQGPVLAPAEAREYGRRGARALQRLCLWRIEGDTVSTKEMAKRLGISQRQAEQRFSRERRKGPVTWNGDRHDT